jgi:hypothetical protein
MARQDEVVKLSYEQVQDVVEQEIATALQLPVARYLLQDRALEEGDLKNELRIAAVYALQRFRPKWATDAESFRRLFRHYLRRKLQWQLLDLRGKIRPALPYRVDNPEELSSEEVE